jgi:cbb3-type cytochrome oxidase subunit 3
MTLALLLVFVGISSWAFSSRQRERFDAAARLPLEEDLGPQDIRGGLRK